MDKTDVDERLNKDMSDYIMTRINRSPSIQTNITPTNTKVSQEGHPSSRFCQFVVSAARGCFLYAKMTLDLVERGHLVIKSSSFNVLPLTLGEIFMLEFNLKFPSSRAFDKVKDILAIGLASLVPLTPVEIFNSLNALVTTTPDNQTPLPQLQVDVTICSACFLLSAIFPGFFWTFFGSKNQVELAKPGVFLKIPGVFILKSP